MPPIGIAYLDGARLRRTLIAACDHAQQYRAELNRINVFPVPDGDTGTNLALTVGAIAARLRGNRERGAGAVAREAAQAAVLGARGNCGMMLSHFLLGFSESIGDRSKVHPRDFAGALDSGVLTLQQALERPVEGTILTVMRETAQAAAESSSPDFAHLLESMITRAQESLRRTPELLPVLREAGVVDAGAKGFVSLLEGALLLLRGRPAPLVGAVAQGAVISSRIAAAEVALSTLQERYRFCTEALVRGAGLPSESEVRRRLLGTGDSLLVIRSAEVLKVHLHTDDPEGTFSFLRSLGTLVAHKAEDMQAQHRTVGRAADGHVRLARRPVTIMTDSACDLPTEVLQAHGIHVTPLLLVTPEGDVLRDGIDIRPEEFHHRLGGGSSALPTTSQPAPADFLKTFADAGEEGEAVLGVIVGSTLSGTFSSAEAAALRFRQVPVHLVDSRAASILQGLLVLKAAELAELGRGCAEIASELTRVRSRSGILFTVDSFARLLASGRVGKGSAWLGSRLHLKPILELDAEGRVVAAGRAWGRARSRGAVLELLDRRVAGAKRVRFGVVHVSAPDIVPGVSEELRRRYGPGVEILSAPATPVLATHLGEGAWAVAWMNED